MISPSAVPAVTSSTSGSDVALDDQRVVAGGLERIGQAREDAAAVVVDPARSCRASLRRAHDPAAEGLADGLVTEAHAEDRDAGSPKRAITAIADAGLVRAARARAR